MRYLLDTNIISDLIHNPGGRSAQRIRDVGEGQVCTSIIVAAELRYGAAKRASTTLTARIEAVLDILTVLPLDEPADAAYGAIRASLEATGQVIGNNDMLIAGHALALGCTVVTDNEGEFRRVEGLRCENWLRSPTTPAP